MGILNEYKDIIAPLNIKNNFDKEFSKPIITEETRDAIKSKRIICRGSVRISHGLFYIDGERKRKMESLLSKKMPR